MDYPPRSLLSQLAGVLISFYVTSPQAWGGGGPAANVQSSIVCVYGTYVNRSLSMFPGSFDLDG